MNRETRWFLNCVSISRPAKLNSDLLQVSFFFSFSFFARVRISGSDPLQKKMKKKKEKNQTKILIKK